MDWNTVKKEYLIELPAYFEEYAPECPDAYGDKAMMTEEEFAVFRRGRNAKVNSVPKAATLGEYHEATALETLFGYLYLTGRRERINELFCKMTEEDDAS